MHLSCQDSVRWQILLVGSLRYTAARRACERPTLKVQLGSGLAAAPEPQSVQEGRISLEEEDVLRVHGLFIAEDSGTGIQRPARQIISPATAEAMA